MKVIKNKKLVEATSGEISSWKNRWNDPEEDRENLINEILSETVEDTTVMNKLKSFGVDFLSNWIESMKIDELGRDTNEFVYFLQSPISSRALENTDNFVKIYNVYASNLFNDEYFDDKIFDNLLANPRLYLYDPDEVKFVFEIYNAMVDNNADTTSVINTFYDDNGDLNQPAEIQANFNEWKKLSGKNQVKYQSESEREQIKKAIDQALKDPNMIDYIKQKLNNR